MTAPPLRWLDRRLRWLDQCGLLFPILQIWDDDLQSWVDVEVVRGWQLELAAALAAGRGCDHYLGLLPDEPPPHLGAWARAYVRVARVPRWRGPWTWDHTKPRPWWVPTRQARLWDWLALMRAELPDLVRLAYKLGLTGDDSA